MSTKSTIEKPHLKPMEVKVCFQLSFQTLFSMKGSVQYLHDREYGGNYAVNHAQKKPCLRS